MSEKKENIVDTFVNFATEAKLDLDPDAVQEMREYMDKPIAEIVLNVDEYGVEERLALLKGDKGFAGSYWGKSYTVF